MRYLAFMLMLTGCYVSDAPVTRPMQTKRIVAGVMANNNAQWLLEALPYSRPWDDPDFPKFLIVAEDRSACLVDGPTFALKPPGQYATCHRWRWPR